MQKCIEFSHCLHRINPHTTDETHLKYFFRYYTREQKKNVNIIGSNQCSHVEIYLLLNLFMSCRLFFRPTQLYLINFSSLLLLLWLYCVWMSSIIEKEIHIKALVVIEVICTCSIFFFFYYQRVEILYIRMCMRPEIYISHLYYYCACEPLIIYFESQFSINKTYNNFQYQKHRALDDNNDDDM